MTNEEQLKHFTDCIEQLSILTDRMRKAATDREMMKHVADAENKINVARVDIEELGHRLAANREAI